ncbi:hypothetical protein ACFV7R_38200 [Streptomyces sp. NPDC059866]|uniref:hypothetical protein n=1 Tax=Streptomyces sp. NPDC059866 TaxID=3346978 RepID=UPI00364657EB
MEVRRKRIIRNTALVTAGALVVLGGSVWLYGMNDRELGRACGGMLPVDDVRAVLGDDRLDVESRSGDGIDTCEVSASTDGGGSTKVSIVDTTWIGVYSRLSVSFAGVPANDMLPVPIGNGWLGLFAADTAPINDGEATTTLLLTCGEGSSKTSAGKPVKGLAVTVETELDTTLDDPANRPAYIRIATGTAAKAAKAYGCVTHLGQRRVRTVGLPVTEEEFEPLSGASGTCLGIRPTSDVTTAWETARDRAPLEKCRLGDDGVGNHRYSLVAYFGAYAAQLKAGYKEELRYTSDPTPADAPKGRLPGDGSYWGSAACPADAERAVFIVSRTRDTDGQQATEAERKYARTALRTFAEHSSEAHGCLAPTTP